MLRTDWEKMGARVTLKVFELSTFSTEVLSPRKYDVLFFGQIIGRTPDPFAYWHSSQRFSPGLNVALYANKKVDTLLENARQERDETARALLLQSFETEIAADVPAVFVYSPDFLYATGENIRGMHTGFITTESERFLDIADWYIDSEYVWKWFRDRTVREN
jgi:peptide/nickel transport system substrate-binding protein